MNKLLQNLYVGPRKLLSAKHIIYVPAKSIYITRRKLYPLKIAKVSKTQLPHLKPVSQNIDYNRLTSIEDLVSKIDTTLTPVQQAHVEKLKKKMKGNGSRTQYRDVPKVNEILGFNGFMPNVPENADKLIDWALAHIPPRAGPRRSREKKRIALRESLSRANHAKRIEELQASHQRKVVSSSFRSFYFSI
jgi:hypothetical protein